MKRLAILGASGHGKVVADTAELSGWDEIIFYDDKWPDIKQNGCWQISGDTKSLISSLSQFDGVVVAIGDNRIRMEKHQLLGENKAVFANIIHPDATVSRYVDLEPGIVVFAGAVVNVGSSLGLGCIINTGAIIDHDCILGACTHVSPGAHLAGRVRVGDMSWIGLGADIIQQVKIGREVVVGAGAVVIRSVADNQTVVGIPARELK